MYFGRGQLTEGKKPEAASTARWEGGRDGECSGSGSRKDSSFGLVVTPSLAPATDDPAMIDPNASLN